MWFATPSGVSRLAQGRWQSYSTYEGLPANDVNTLAVDSTGVLWLGTANGLAFADGRGVHVPGNLPILLQDSVVGLAPDARGSLWITTTTHVLRASRDKLLRGDHTDAEVREYGLADGLHSLEGVRRYRSAVTDPGGRVWLALGRGLSMIDPSHAVSGSAPAIAHIESASSDGATVESQRAGADSGRPPAAHLHLCRVSLPSRSASGSAIASTATIAIGARRSPRGDQLHEPRCRGDYRFRVMASNSEGEWTPVEAAVSVVIDPRFWQRPWFQLACAALIVLASAAAYRLRIHQVARRLNERFEERLAERTRIAQDLHDTLLQGFVSASMQLHVAAGHVPADSAARPSLDRVLQPDGPRHRGGPQRRAWPALARHGRRPRAGVLPHSAGARRRRHGGLPRHCRRAPAAAASDYPRRGCTVSGGGVVNAVRHSGAQKIEIEIDYAAAHVRMLVRDDGCGIDADVLKSGREGHWGLSGMRERADRIGARFKVWSRAAAGTEVELLVPGRVAFQPLSPEGPGGQGAAGS